MSNEYFPNELGGLWMNFLSLDAVLRVFLGRLPNATALGVPYGTDIHSLPIGAEIPESSQWNMEFFSTLVKEYNREVIAHGLGSQIDEALIELRNALAHGFVSTDINDGPMRLLKLSKSKQGYVKIALNEVMTESWFKIQKRRVFDSIHIVYSSLNSLPDPKPPSEQ